MKNYKFNTVGVSELNEYELNSRTHDEMQIKQIRDSIEEFGFTNPILIDESNRIIAGHGRVIAAKELGMVEVPAIVVDGLSEEQLRVLVIADNKIALNAGWDKDILKMEMESISDSGIDIGLTGFDLDEIAEILQEEVKDKEILGSVVFSEELGESNNYIVLYFDNDIDWLNAKTVFNLDSVSSMRANGKPWSKGIGRVVNGAKFIDKIRNGDL